MKILKTILLVLACFACSKDDVLTFGCIDTPKDNTTPVNCNPDSYPSDHFCKLDFREFHLQEESLQYIPQYCEDNITYRNNEGETLSFLVFSKTHTIERQTWNSHEPCPEEPTKRVRTCIFTEIISYRMRTSDEVLDFTIRIANELGLDRKTEEGIGEFLTVIRGNPRFVHVEDFRYVLNQADLTYSSRAEEEFYDTIELNGILYSDVISVDLSFVHNPQFKFYFTKNIGLLGFEDLNNVLWTLVD